MTANNKLGAAYNIVTVQLCVRACCVCSAVFFEPYLIIGVSCQVYQMYLLLALLFSDISTIK